MSRERRGCVLAALCVCAALGLRPVCAQLAGANDTFPCQLGAAVAELAGATAGNGSRELWSCASLAHGGFFVAGIPEWLRAAREVFPGVTLVGKWVLVDASVADMAASTMPVTAILSLLAEASVLALLPPAERAERSHGAAAARAAAALRGEHTVLVVRTAWGDTPAAFSAAELSAHVFTDAGNVRTQYAACSAGRFTLTPAVGASIVGGVVDVQVPSSLQGRDMRGPTYTEALETQAVQALEAKLGPVGDRFGFVFFSFPAGSFADGERWYAYAYLPSAARHPMSFYNGDNVRYITIQMHETGHSLGLQHSAEGGEEYGDTSGNMGASWFGDNAPKMCFNPAKTFQLGWFDECHRTVDRALQEPVAFRVAGVGEFDESLNCASDPSIALVIRVTTAASSASDLYIGYNRGSGANADTTEYPNRVTLVSAASSSSFSFMQGALAAGQTQTYGAVRVARCEEREGVVHVALASASDPRDLCDATLGVWTTPVPTTTTPAPTTTPPPPTLQSPAAEGTDAASGAGGGDNGSTMRVILIGGGCVAGVLLLAGLALWMAHVSSASKAARAGNGPAVRTGGAPPVPRQAGMYHLVLPSDRQRWG